MTTDTKPVTKDEADEAISRLHALADIDVPDPKMPAHAADLIRRLAAERDGLTSALREFPHFSNGESITPAAVAKVVGEHIDMIMTWVPLQTEIEFVDDDGNEFCIRYEDGDAEAGIASGWVADESWYPVARAKLTEPTP